jgi:hypothetical protein
LIHNAEQRELRRAAREASKGLPQVSLLRPVVPAPKTAVPSRQLVFHNCVNGRWVD